MFYTMYNTVQKSKVRVLVEKHLIFCGIICTVRNILSAYIICLEVCTEKKELNKHRYRHIYISFFSVRTTVRGFFFSPLPLLLLCCPQERQAAKAPYAPVAEGGRCLQCEILLSDTDSAA